MRVNKAKLGYRYESGGREGREGVLVYSRFMLFPTFLENFFLGGGGGVFMRVNKAKLGYRYESGGREGREGVLASEPFGGRSLAFFHNM